MSNNLTWEEMFEAIKAISPSASLMMREPGNWYVEAPGVEIKKGCLLSGDFGNGDTPVMAVVQHFRKWTELPSDQCLVKDAHTDKRRHYVWAGFMWRELPV